MFVSSVKNFKCCQLIPFLCYQFQFNIKNNFNIIQKNINIFLSSNIDNIYMMLIYRL